MAKNIIDIKGGRPPSLIIMVDYSNWLYRAFFSSFKDLEIKPWMPFIRALDMLRTCVRIARDNRQTPVTFIFAGDTVRKKLDKMKIDETYKGDRPALTDLRFYIFRHIMNIVVGSIGCKILEQEGYEADEVIASCVRKLVPFCGCTSKCLDCECAKSPHENDIVIFSADKDLEICLSYKFVELYKGYGKFYTKQDYLDEYGFGPKFHLTYKALVGDKCNDVKPVPMWGEAKAKEHIIKGDWLDLVKKDSEKLLIFNNNIRKLAMNWDLPIENYEGYKLQLVELDEVSRKIQSDYHKQEAIDEILFEIRRLIEECK